jgi:uncharacterized protein YjbJ (UPF0337 family)
MGHREHRAVPDHDGTDRHLAGSGRRACRRESLVERPDGARGFLLSNLDRIDRHGVYHPIAGAGSTRRRRPIQGNVNAWNIRRFVIVASSIAAPPRDDWTEGNAMSSTTDKIKGAANEALGKAKQGLGDVTNNDKMKADGAAQELKGKAQSTVGDAKGAVKSATDKL